MAYIVPREIPKSCHECQFHYCTEYHPFWSADKEKRNTKTIRCQAIEPFRSTILDIKDETFKADWCPLVNATDVVPKSEVVNILDELMKEAREIADLYEKSANETSDYDYARIEYRGCQIGALLVLFKIAELKKKYTEGET